MVCCLRPPGQTGGCSGNAAKQRIGNSLAYDTTSIQQAGGTMASRPFTPPRVRAASLLQLTDEAASSPGGGYGPIVLRGNSPNDRTQSGERSPKSPHRQMDTQNELTDSVTSQAMLARPGLGGLMRDDNGQSHSNQRAAAQRLSGSNSSHLGMSEETRSGMNGDGNDQEMMALPESASRDRSGCRRSWWGYARTLFGGSHA